MKKKKNEPGNYSKTENVADLKKQSTGDKEVKKGYNEQNPVQPHGAFKPDVATKKN